MSTAERRIALAGALVLYLAFIAYQSLAGGARQACAVPLIDPGAGWSGSDALANVVAYVPAGLLGGALALSFGGPFGGFAARAVALLALSAFSLSMELMQACLSGRVSSWVDWTTNSFGAALGLVALPLVLRGLHRLPASHPRRARAPAQVAFAAWLVVAAWLASSTAPWRFTFDVGTVRSNLAFLATVPVLNAWDVARHAFAWMAVAAALRALVDDRARASLALAVALAVSLGAQALLVGRALSWSELAGAALGVSVAWVLLMPASSGRLARLMPMLALASVAAYELAPGRWSWGLGGGFSWVPLVGRGQLLAALDFALYFCWFAFVLVLSLRWRRARTRTAVALGGFAVAAMLALEAAQRTIPGRIADTSPAFIVALAFVVAWLLGERTGEADADRVDRGATGRVRSTVRRPGARSARRS